MKKIGFRCVSCLIILVLLWAFIPAQKVDAAFLITSAFVWPMGMPMVDDVVVQNGATLYIMGGNLVPVICSDAAPHPGGVDPTRVEIIIENGGLIIDGATLFDPTGLAGCWYGIEFRPGTFGVIQNSSISDAVIGITANTANVAIINNDISNMQGVGVGFPGAPGMLGAGILLAGTPGAYTIVENDIHTIHGGAGAAGMPGLPGPLPSASGTAGGNGGDGGMAAGIYLDGVMPPAQIMNNLIYDVHGGLPGPGGNGGDGAGGANQLGMIPPQGGGNGGKGGKGGDGGDAAGIYSLASDFLAIDNTIRDIYGGMGGAGGNGGHGGKGGDASPINSEPGMPGLPGANGGNGGDGGGGGFGGEATGIYDGPNSIGLMDHNTIYNILAGYGGNGGIGGNGGAGGLGGQAGLQNEFMPGIPGGNGGMGGSGGNGGLGGGGGWVEGIYSDQAMPNMIDRNTIHDIRAGDGGQGGMGGIGAVGGAGGAGSDEGTQMLQGGPGGFGGPGGAAGSGGGGGGGGSALGVGLYSSPTLVTPVTNSDIYDIFGGLGGAGGPGGIGGNGGQGGNGGNGLPTGLGGNGGNGGLAGNGGPGGKSGFASGIDVVNTGPTLTNNTIVDIISYEFGGHGGPGGAGGLGGPGGGPVTSPGLPGANAPAGSIGANGNGNHAIGIYLEAYAPALPQVFNNIVVNHINMPPSTMDIGIYQWPGSSPVVLDYNNVWNWTTLYSPPTIAGVNDISLAPLFEGSYNHRLTITSPCVDTALYTAHMRPGDDHDYTPRNQDGNRDGISGVDMGAFERWVIRVDKASDHTPSQLVAKGDTVVYTLTIRTVDMGPRNSATTVSLNETLPAGMSLISPVVCPTSAVVENPTGFTWSGSVSGAKDETCVYSARVTSFHPSFSNSAGYTDRDGTWTTNTVVNYWNYQVFLPLIIR